MARTKKPKSAKKPKPSKISKLPDNFREAIEAKQAKDSGWESGRASGHRNTGFSGRSPKRTGGRDR